MANEADIQNTEGKNRVIKLSFKETTGHGAVSEIIELDVAKDTILQVNATVQEYTIETTSHTGKGNTDLDDAAVPWITLKDGITADFHSGQALDNRGLVGIKITTAGVLSANFEIYIAQQKLEERDS